MIFSSCVFPWERHICFPGGRLPSVIETEMQMVGVAMWWCQRRWEEARIDRWTQFTQIFTGQSTHSRTHCRLTTLWGISRRENKVGALFLAFFISVMGGKRLMSVWKDYSGAADDRMCLKSRNYAEMIFPVEVVITGWSVPVNLMQQNYNICVKWKKGRS